MNTHLSLFQIAGNINAKDPDLWISSSDPGVRNTDWMNSIPDSRMISDMSIPGTHDSLALYGNVWSTCQSLSLLMLLSVGVRFFDVRCRHYKTSLPIHHGSFFQKRHFSDVLRDMNSFLTSNPSEFLLVRVKEEYNPKDPSRPFWKTVETRMANYPGLFWMDKSIPTIGQVRGKIVLLTDFPSDKVLGIPYNSMGRRGHIEDHYKENAGDSKWSKVKNNLQKAKYGSSSDMYLTFNSASGNPLGIQCPREIARKMNPRLHDYVRSQPRRARLGIIAIDYPGPRLIQDIINRN